MDCEQIWVCSEHLARYVNILWTDHLHPLANYFLSRLWTNHAWRFLYPGMQIFERWCPPADSALGNLGFSQQENCGFAGKIGSSPRTKWKKQRFHQHISHENIGIVDINDDSPAYAMSTRPPKAPPLLCYPVDLDKVSVLRVGKQKRLQQLSKW